MTDYDGMRTFFSYGWGGCGTNHGQMRGFADDAGRHGRRPALDEVINTNHHYAEWNPDPGLGFSMPQANTHGGYADFTTGVTGTVPCRSLQWRSYYGGVWAPVPAASGGNYKMYGEGFTASPIV